MRQLYFIEVNARVQVEHPVTEFVTGIDIVKSQIRIAQGERLEEVLPGPVELRGHAIECRINAENPETFAPSPGRITGFHTPGGIGVRVDTWAYTDCVIPPFYDSLVAKLIAYGSDRAEAIQRMRRALDMLIIEGIHTSIPLHRKFWPMKIFRRRGSIQTLLSDFFLCRRPHARRSNGRNRACASVNELYRNRLLENECQKRFGGDLYVLALGGCLHRRSARRARARANRSAFTSARHGPDYRAYRGCATRHLGGLRAARRTSFSNVLGIEFDILAVDLDRPQTHSQLGLAAELTRLLRLH